MRSTSIALLALTTYLFSCKCDEQKVVYPIGDDMYTYVFNDSSYWIYENTTTSDLDTVLLYHAEHGSLEMDTDGKCIHLEKEFFLQKFVSSKKHVNNTEIFFLDYEGIRQNGTGTFPYKGLQIYNRLVNVGDSTIYSKYTNFYHSINIKGQTYNNVKKIWPHYYLPNSSDTFYYWAPHVGIVRKEFHSNGTIEYWDLIYKSLK